MKHIYSLLVLQFCFGWQLLAQASNKKERTDYHKEFSVGMGVVGRGFNSSFIYGLANKPYVTTLFNVDLLELKSAKEKKQNLQNGGGGRNSNGSILYGKQNNFYLMRVGWGRKHYISEKSNDQSITLALSYQTGFSSGFLKPYYLKLAYFNASGAVDVRTEAYTNENEYLFLDPNAIRGKGGFGMGWDDLKILPGFFTKASVWVDFGADQSFLTALELGVNVDYFPRRVPIMALTENSPVFINISANFYMGGRW
jgi:hypothetical protein